MNWPIFSNWMKNTLLFTYSTNVPVCLLTVNMKKVLTPEKSENVRPHSSYSIENVAPLKSIQSLKCDPIQGTSPLAYKEAPPQPEVFARIHQFQAIHGDMGALFFKNVLEPMDLCSTVSKDVCELELISAPCWCGKQKLSISWKTNPSIQNKNCH